MRDCPEERHQAEQQIEDPCLVCGAESDFGAHGIRDGEVYSEYFCEKHYHAKDEKMQPLQEEEENNSVLQGELVSSRSETRVPKVQQKASSSESQEGNEERSFY